MNCPKPLQYGNVNDQNELSKTPIIKKLNIYKSTISEDVNQINYLNWTITKTMVAKKYNC